MKDLDFDELDRAVSTLMGNVSGVAEPAKQDDTKVLTITETLKDNRPPVLPVGEVAMPTEGAVQPESPAMAAKQPAPAPQARPTPLAARRGGRFMDVVAPTSMSRRPTPLQGVSRQGVSLAPLDTVAEKHDAPEPTISREVVDTSFAPAVARAEPDTKAATEWPDPLEFNQTSDEAPVIEESAPQADVTEPLNSPFLANAKVEKRPLGTPAPELSDPAQYESEAVAVVDDQAASEPEVLDQPSKLELPEELQGDVMAIESSVSTGVGAEPAVDNLAPAAEAPQPDKERIEPKVATASVAAGPSVALSAGTGSIPQQYREEPSTGDQTTGSIYDTASYHQPLEHPAKKKAGWLWVIWVLALLILGAGGGALAYLYLLQ